jgi:hypothetical protein
MKDQVWAIRKVCADLFSTFAVRCTRRTRETVLTENFIKLLDDNSRWVKISAYKSLGPFIATFIRQKNELGYDSSQLEQITSESESNNTSMTDIPSTELASKILPLTVDSKSETNSNAIENSSSDKNNNENDDLDQKGSNENEYSNFVYWRNSLPNLEDSLNLISTNSEETKKDENCPTTPPKFEQKESNTSSTIGNNNSSTILTGLLNSSNLLEKLVNNTNNNSGINKSSENTPNFYSSVASFYNNSNQNQNQPLHKTIEQLTTELKQVFNLFFHR